MSQIRKHDKRYNTSLIRELQMALEGCTSNPGIIIQFFKNLALYGIDEALIYLRSYCCDTMIDEHVIPTRNRIVVALTRVRIHNAIREKIEVARNMDELNFWNGAAIEFQRIPIR